MKFGFGALGVASAIAMVFGAPAYAQEASADAELEDIAARYGVRSSVLDISLSPSGTKIAWIAPGAEHTEMLKVYDMTGSEGIQTIIQNTEKTGDLSQCEWVTDERLVCQIYVMAERSDGVLLPFTRMIALNDDGSDVKAVSERRSARALRFNQSGGSIVALDALGEDGKILITKNYVKDVTIGTRLANDKEGLGVDLYDVTNGRRKVREQPDNGAIRYVADETGRLRLKVRAETDPRGNLTGRYLYFVRTNDSNQWASLDGVLLDGAPAQDFVPVAVDAARDSIFGYASVDGFDALVEVPVGEPAAGMVVFKRDDVDVGSLIRIGRQRRVVGISYATEKTDLAYFDEDLAKLTSSLGKALPNQPNIRIVGASADENRLLIDASSDTDPGTIYLYDKASRKLEELLANREFLVNRKMGAMQPIEYSAADGTSIPGYLTLPPGSDGKNLPAIVMPHGGPAARDTWGFEWMVQFFTARGYAVLQPNFRGSAGYGEAWFGKNGYQAWDLAIGDVNDAARWMVSEGIADPDKLAIAGWSYGGYAALQSQVVDPDLFKAVVAIAPVTDLEYLRSDARSYTSSRLRDEQLGKGPHIAAGSPRRHADKFAAPVALFHGTFDLNVDVRHSREMQDALEDAGKPVQYTEYKELEHSLRDSKVRAEMLAEIDRFLNKSLDR